MSELKTEILTDQEQVDPLKEDNEKLLEFLLKWEDEYKKYQNVSGVGKHSEVKNEMSEFIKTRLDGGLGLELVLRLTDDNLEELDAYPEKVSVGDDFKARVFKYVTDGGSKETCIRLPQLNSMPTLESGGAKLVLTPDFIKSMEFVKQA